MAAKRNPITNEQFKKASDAGHRLLMRGPLAVSARYAAGRVHVELNNGCMFVFPIQHVQGLTGAKVADLKVIEVEASGLGLHWPRLNADLYVPAVVKGVLGTRQWMAQIGALGGRASSVAKAASSRANGAKGGRPRRDRLEDIAQNAIEDARKGHPVRKVRLDEL